MKIQHEIAVSIVIPACNEAEVIERCLQSILDDADGLRLDVVVVCNGCTDDTAERARRFGHPVRVFELPVASKGAALAYGDAAARGFPRFFVDADVELHAATIRALASRLQDDSPFIVGAPRVVFELADRPWSVRAFYRTWLSLPFFRSGFIGAGVYALSRRGRQRFDEFPDIVADDGFIRLLARPEERLTLTEHSFRAWPPRRLTLVLQVMTRVRAGRRELARRYPELIANEITGPARTLGELAAAPRRWHEAAVYLLVMGWAEMAAVLSLWLQRSVPWAQDRSSRHPSASLLASSHRGKP